jgi:S1-C subfamily serine protease
MRLYSRGQVILFSASAIVIVFLAALGLGILHLPHAGTAEDVAAVEEYDERAPAPVSAEPKVISSPNLVAADSALEYTQDERENIWVYERLNSGVVNITTEVVSINYFLEPVPSEGGSGSGSIIDARGYVLTNYHVVKDAYKVYVNLADGSRYEGKVQGTDEENDLAVLKFDPSKDKRLTVVPYGDSANLRVGQKVLAIGNPFGLERTLTRGIVSGIGRPVQQDSKTIIRDMIQTDASINPGNSGGPLLNSRGEMIGINTMIYSPSGGSVGVGFAVPVNTAKRVVPDLIRYGMVKRGWIDVTAVQLFPALVEFMKGKGYPVPVEQGLLVSQSRRNGNADRAGIRGGSTPARYYSSVFYVGGDILTAVDGKSVASIADLYSALETTKPGQEVSVEFYRGGKKMTVKLPLSDRADYRKEE